MRTVEMYESYSENQYPINNTSNALALIRILDVLICTSQRVQLYRENAGHVIAFFCGEAARSALVKSYSLIALDLNDLCSF